MERTHSFGYWVRRRRKALDLSQRRLAELAACSMSTIKKIEQDTRRPSRQLAEILADRLAIPRKERAQFLRSARGLAPVDEMALASQPVTPSGDETGHFQAAVSGSLPADVSPIFGRETELAGLIGRISQGDSRLIAIVGPGGVGKSRLALEAARHTQNAFRDGAWFVPLAGVDKPANLSTAIAVAKGLAFAGPLDQDEQLVRQLKDRQLLLFLDNFEQLLPDGAGLVASLIRKLPEMTVLVTSRERLRLRAEMTVPLNGLSTEPARALFLERAQRTGADLEVDPAGEVSTAIDEICDLVGGSPLAIELAAAWSRLLSPREILADLERGLDLLAGDLRDLPERHRSMRAVFSASWSRLSPDGRKLLAGLSVFAGSFTRATAEYVCKATLPQLAMLHDHSLIQRDAERFRLHELIRQFAAEKLAGILDHQAAVKERHAAYYADFLGRMSALIKSGGSQQAGWQAAVEREMDDIQVAWRWAVTKGHPQRLLPAALALYLYLDLKGQVREGVQMCAALGESAAGARAEAIEDQAILRRTEAIALVGQGGLGLRMGRVGQGQEQLKQALSLLEGLDAPDERIAAIGLLGPVAMLTYDSDAGQRVIEDTLALARRHEHAWGQGLAVNFLGLFHFSQGRMGRARECLLEAVTLWNDQPGLIYCRGRSLVHLGLTHHALGDYESAQSIQEEALKLAQAVRDYSFVPLSRCNLAYHHFAQGDLTLAKAGFQTALAEALRLSLLASVGHSILGLGLVAAAEGLVARAVTLLSYGTARPGAYTRFLLGEPQRVLADLRGKLSPAEFTAAEARAQEMDLDGLIAWL